MKITINWLLLPDTKFEKSAAITHGKSVFLNMVIEIKKTDSPEAIKQKLKNYSDKLANKENARLEKAFWGVPYKGRSGKTTKKVA